MGTCLSNLKESYSGKKLSDAGSIGGKGRLTGQLIYLPNIMEMQSGNIVTHTIKCQKLFGRHFTTSHLQMPNLNTTCVLKEQIVGVNGKLRPKRR